MGLYALQITVFSLILDTDNTHEIVFNPNFRLVKTLRLFQDWFDTYLAMTNTIMSVWEFT